jgi:hypothetical protein
VRKAPSQGMLLLVPSWRIDVGTPHVLHLLVGGVMWEASARATREVTHVCRIVCMARARRAAQSVEA